MPIIAGQITGSALTASVDYTFIANKPSGIVSGAAQVAPLLPAGTVSSSEQYPGWVTASSQIDYNSIQNKLSGVISSSTQFNALTGTSASFAITAATASYVSGNVQFTNGLDITGSLLVAGQISASSLTGSLNYTNLISVPVGIVSSSTQINSLLPNGTVSSSVQIDYNSITNKLSDIVSSSTQVKPLLPGGTVSASGQVDITATTNYSTFSSSLATVDAGQTTRIDNLASLTSSYAINATIQSQLANVVSSSAQVKPLLPEGTVSSSGQVVVQNTTGIGALATTGSNTFTANQTITGSLFISQNLTVLGSSSISYISQSTLNIGTNVITMNTNTPGTRFGGIEVIDSGSSPLRSGSLYFDSINDQWIFVHQNTAGGTTSSVVMMGPATFNNIGNETYLTQNRVLKGGGLEHITDSQISDNGVTVSITNGLSVGTNLTASQADITTLRATSITSSVSGALTGTFPYASLTSIPSGIVSSSSQVAPLLPANTVSSSAQYPGWVTASSQIDYNSITNKLSGVISSSTQFNALSGTSASFATTAITASYISGNIQFNNGLDVTGSLLVIGAVSASSLTGSILSPGVVSASSQYPGWVTASSQIDYNSITNKLSGVYSSSTQIAANLPAGTVSASAQVVAGVAAQTIAPTNVNATNILSGSVLQTGTNALIGGKLAVTGALEVTGTVTASNLTANQAVFTNGSDGLVSNAITGTGNVVMSASPTLTGTLTAANITANGTLLLQGIYSSSTQVDYNSIQNKLSGVISSSTQFNALTGTSASFAATASSVNTLLQTVSASGDIAAGVNLVSNFSSGDEGGEIQLARPQTNSSISGSVTIDIYQNKLRIFEANSPNRGAFIDFTGLASGVNRNLLGNDGVVSSSGQVNITATSGYSTFSSSIATKNDLQDVSINALNAATSSYAINSTIQGQLAGVVSSSTQVKPLLPGGTVSASGQVDITATTGYSTFSSSLATVDVGQTTRIDNLASLTSSYAINSTIQSQLAGVISSSAQTVASIANQTIAPTAVNATNINSTAVTASGLTANQAVFTNASNGLVSNAITGTGNVVMSASPTLTGTLTAANITANGTLLLQNIVSQSSAPTFTGLTSTGTVLLAGIYSSSAQTVAAIASQTIAPTNVNATNILSGSVLQTGTNALIGGKLAVTGSAEFTGTVTASNLSANQAVFTNANDGLVSNAITGTGNVVMSASPTLTGTITAANITANGTLLLQGIYSSSTQVDYNSIQNKLSGVVSSSAQVQPLLPGGTVSSSAQYPGWVTASSQIALSGITGTTFAATDFTFPNNLTVGGTITAEKINTEYVSASVIFESGSSKFGDTADDVMSVTGSIRVLGGTISGSMVGMFSSSAQVDYNSITNKLSGVVSSSAQVQPLLPGGTVSSSGQVDYNSITNKLSGVVSSSTQIATLLPASTVSSSTQVVAGVAAQTIAPTNVNATNILSGSVLQTGTNALIGGKLAVTGSTEFTGTVTASNLNASQAVFTNASDGLVSNAITGTGNVVMSASPTLTGTLTAANITANGTLLLQNIVSQSSSPSFTGLTSTGTVLLAGIYSSSAQTVAAIASQTIAPTTVNATSILSSSVLQTGTNALIGGKLAVTGALEVTGTVTASNLTANQAVFTNAVDGLVSNAITGTGNVVMSTSPTLVTPILGTPTSVTLTNATGLPVSTGISGLGTGVATFLATPSSANLASAVTDETGTGALVFANSPTLVTPALGTPSSATLTNATGLPVSTGISGLGTGVATFLATPSSANLAAALTDETGTGANVFAGSPTLTGTVTADKMVLSGSQFAGIVSGSGLQYRLVVPVGTNQYAT